MSFPHFFQARSRLGLKNPPIGSTISNRGVEDAPQAILSKSFLETLGNPIVHTFTFSKPESIPKDHFDTTLARQSNECKELILNSLQESDIQIVLGGDHSVTFPSVLAALERHNDPTTFGYIQFDSHADLNLASESPTGNFHGMYVRALLDNFDIPEIATLVAHRIPVKNVMYVGNLDLDAGETDFITRHSVKTISGAKISTGSKYIDEFKKFANSFKHIHVSFDIDCIDESEAPATGIPAHNGLHLQDIMPLLEIISDHPSFSFDLVEVNPGREGAAQTIECARVILSTILRNFKTQVAYPAQTSSPAFS